MSKYQPPKGTRDILPADMEKRRFVIDKIRDVFQRFGFKEMQTPAFEDYEVLVKKSGEAVKDEIYYFKDKGDRELGLRFDLTVPLARVMGSNPDIPKPFKRLAVGPVWRYDNPGRGRYREFWQIDVDVIGSAGVVADAECVAAAATALRELGFKEFFIRYNNRQFVEGFLESIGVTEAEDTMRIIDKMDKIGDKGVSEELKKKKLSNDQIKKIIEFIQGRVEYSGKGIGEIENFEEACRNLGVSKFIKFDPSLVRGLGYYTGNVFEIQIPGAPGSVGGGGRYDFLLRFYGNDSPAVGISFGIDRLVDTMDEKKMFPSVMSKSVFVAAVKDEVRNECAKIAQKLRELGFAAEYDLADRKLSKQMEYASKSASWVIVVGPKELEQNILRIKDMTTGAELERSFEEVVEMLKKG